MLAWLTTLLWWALSGAAALLVAAAIDLALMPRSRFHTWRSLIMTYLVRRICQLVGWYKWRKICARYTDVMGAQEDFVLKTVKRHAGSDYGRQHRFSEMHSLEDFRRLHPVTDYSHYKSYIDRAMEGDVGVLFSPGEEIIAYFCSSGTTGESKHIPVTKAAYREQYGTLFGAINYFPSNLRKIVCHPVAPRWRYSPSGVKIGAASSYNLSSPVFTCQITTLPEAQIFTEASKALHVGFVLSLRDKQVCIWDAAFIFCLLNQLQFLERNWSVLVDDIRCGRLSPSLDVTEEERRTIDSLLSPEPERADELQREFERGFDGIVPRVFPHITKVLALSSGSSMDVYRERCSFYLGDLPMTSSVFGASEGFIGVNFNKPGEAPGYALIPGINFIEFLPVDESGEVEEGATPLLVSEIKLDHLYEVVLTNASGLYRYRMGDVVRVVGTHLGTPTFDFQFRAKQMLNVHMEKVSEAAFTGALRRAVDGWPDHQLVDFTTAESVLDPAAAAAGGGDRSSDSGGSPPYYLVLLELSGPPLPPERANDIDDTLQREHFVYRSFRVKSSIDAMRVVRVRPGTFAAYRQQVFDTTPTTLLQYKQPRRLRTDEQVKFFLDRQM